ncbi:MAG: hypothetical protein N2039_13000 [Gemmataceae bacterium]|nr:hypothetical protein [Gemmataceae bacterium]
MSSDAEREAKTAGPRFKWAGLGWCLLFALAHTQSPLYYSNQNQYFLHGLAWAGHGFLRLDWLANTADPTPLFSLLVAGAYRFPGEWMFQAAYLLVLMGYAAIGWRVYRIVTGQSPISPGGMIFLTFLTLCHWAPLRLASAHGLGVDYPWYLQAGVAGQYILGPGLQPSVAGVLLLLAMAVAAGGRLGTGVVVAAAACLIHSTYLLPAAFFTLACMIAAWPTGGVRSAVRLGLTALAVVTPILVYDVFMFAPSDSETFAESQRILAHERIPHHAQISRWFDPIAALQYAWIVVGIVVAGSGLLRRLMISCLTLSLAFTGVQWITGSDSLALAFPWRTTAVLVPLATMIVLARWSTKLAGKLSASRGRAIGSYSLVVMAAGGLFVMSGRLGYRESKEELPLLDFVKTHARPGEVYLIPVEIPRHDKAKRGAVSTTFTPPPRRDREHGLISVDLQRFRLYTGAPIYVDFKSIPYKDVEVVEWWQRLKWVRDLYESGAWSEPAIRDELARRGITHVVVPSRQARQGIGALLFMDDHYAVYALPRP